jgi:hypothetical protein
MKMNTMKIKTLSLTLLILSAAAWPAAAQSSFDTRTAIAAAAVPGTHGKHTGLVAARFSATLELERALDQLRKATAPYLDLVLALEDGWTQRYPLGCASSPEGAQAYHFLNPSLVDGEIDLLRPELLMYEPQEDGSMELIGVDYVVPFDRWTGDEAPTLLGQPFLRNETLGVWALQVWAWRTNPRGMFAAWNPDVSCAHAW